MPTSERFHGTRVFQRGASTRPVAVNEYSTLGTVAIAPNADPEKFPEDMPTTVFTNDVTMRAALGAGGNTDAIWDAVDDQGVVAEMQIVRVAPGAGTGQTQIENTIANIVGSGADNSGVHAFKLASKPAKLFFVPGYTSQRISNAKNPVMAELDGIANRLRSIKIGDTPDASFAVAETYRADFADDKRAYLFHPSVRVLRGSSVVNEPGSGRVAGLFVKRDKEIGGPWESPSNQAMGGILGASRTISYFTGEPDSEANALNQIEITTLKNNSILWGNRTCAADPLDAFVNVVRALDTIDDAIVNAFDWAMDRNLSVPLGTSVIQSLDNFGDELIAAGAVLGFRAWFERPLNSNESLALGILKIEYDREPSAPLEDLQFGARRNLTYYATLADGILQSLERAAA